METSSAPGGTAPAALASRLVVDDSACDVDDLSPCGGVQVTVAGDEEWDGLVEVAAGSAWPGVEALSFLPGTVAEVVRDNLSRHGQAVADTVASVRTWDRSTDTQRTLAWGDARFGAGSSRLQELLPDGTFRYAVLDVSFLFRQADLTAPLRDEQLAGRLGVSPGARVPLGQVRQALRHA